MPRSLRVGLTGGVGSGKSALGAALRARGATVIDADVVAREVVEPGTAGLAAVVERFGPGVLTPDGALDRAALAGIVFGDPEALKDLNGIVHPLVGARSAELMAAAPPGIVVYEVPLLVESGRPRVDFDLVVVVETPLALRLERLSARGLTEADARARIAAQGTDEQRRAVADELVVNDGSRADLEAAADALWQRLRARLAAAEPSS